VARRARALEAKVGPDGLLSGLVARAARDLAPYAERAAASLAAASPTLERARAESRRQDLDALEETADDLSRRAEAQQAVHVFTEWSAWTSLRRRSERLRRACGDEARRAAFDAVYPAACNYAVWLFNVRGEKLLAHGIFRWLHAEAKAVGARSETVGLLAKNMAAGHGGA
jgi:hypothetical protein